MALLYYYQLKIPYGTWVNDIYCTGMTYEEAAESLAEQNTYAARLRVKDIDGNIHILEPEEKYYTISFRENLDRIIAEEKQSALFQNKYITYDGILKIVDELWQEYMGTLSLFTKEDVGNERRLEITCDDENFYLIDHYENILDKEMASELIKAAFEARLEEIDLYEKGCYYTPDFTDEDKAIIAEYEALKSFCSKMRLDLLIQGEIYNTIGFTQLKDWIMTDESGKYVYDKGGQLMLDDQKVKAFVQDLEKELTTYWGKNWEFINHNGESIEVKAGNYGKVLLSNKLEDAIWNAFEKGLTTAYELEFEFYPSYIQESTYGDIGTSYVEVDTIEQHVYLYIDGECVLDSPCVTGNVSWNMETPKGVFYIEYKQRNRTLRGPGYATPVSYWMHFYNHCGFHDAGWRNAFGEDIYLEDGSHGCVNMPVQKAKELYDLVYKGMPVIIY